jgi:hypothetical protein
MLRKQWTTHVPHFHPHVEQREWIRIRSEAIEPRAAHLEKGWTGR